MERLSLLCMLLATGALAQGLRCPDGFAPGARGTHWARYCIENGSHTCPAGYGQMHVIGRGISCARPAAKRPCDETRGEKSFHATGPQQLPFCWLEGYDTCPDGFELLEIDRQYRCVSKRPMLVDLTPNRGENTGIAGGQRPEAACKPGSHPGPGEGPLAHHCVQDRPFRCGAGYRPIAVKAVALAPASFACARPRTAKGCDPARHESPTSFGGQAVCAEAISDDDACLTDFHVVKTDHGYACVSNHPL